MSTQQPLIGQVYTIEPCNPGDPSATRVLIETDALEATRVCVASGEQHPTFRAESDVLLICVHGRASVQLKEAGCELPAGHMLYLAKNEPHSVRGIEDSVLLVINPDPSKPHGRTNDAELKHPEQQGRPAPKADNLVDEASQESFPASDSPSWTPGVAH